MLIWRHQDDRWTKNKIKKQICFQNDQIRINPFFTPPPKKSLIIYLLACLKPVKNKLYLEKCSSKYCLLHTADHLQDNIKTIKNDATYCFTFITVHTYQYSCFAVLPFYSFSVCPNVKGTFTVIWTDGMASRVVEYSGILISDVAYSCLFSCTSMNLVNFGIQLSCVFF